MRPRTYFVIALAAIPVYLLATRSSARHEPPEVSTSDLAHIETLAGEATGTQDDLSRAIALAARHDRAWDAHPGGDAPGAREAIEALGRWTRSHGELPHQHDMTLYRVGKLAIANATVADPASLEIGRRLGHRLVTEGRGLLEGMLGTSLLRQAAGRSHELGLVPTTWWVPPPESLSRVLASEAMAVRRAAHTSETDEVLAFWAHVLGSVEDEPAAATLARLRRTPAPTSMPGLEPMVTRLAGELAELQGTAM